SRAIDSMYYLHADDIIEPLHLENGRLRVPSGLRAEERARPPRRASVTRTGRAGSPRRAAG
ncbi:hypothetical protein, partial [Streptomyces sp. NPDC051014]|uniref:hypothetical protein n=1 Tax=Streptomyces sp. NPDC051014 TaxID=3155751 RepID=UPI0033E35EC4